MYFTEQELSCPCCNENKFNERTLEKLNALREECDFPFVVTSAYRCEEYNREKGFTQTHATGRAIDIHATHERAHEIVTKARQFGFTGIGVAQKGPVKTRFIHIDDLPNSVSRPRPNIWSY